MKRGCMEKELLSELECPVYKIDSIIEVLLNYCENKEFNNNGLCAIHTMLQYAKDEMKKIISKF